MKIEVYSDGSGNTFDSDGGWGYRIVVDESPRTEGSGYLVCATNNTAELTAAIEALKAVQIFTNTMALQLQDIEVTLISDSQLVLGYANGTYKCKALHLTQLYIELRRLYGQLNAKTKWVKGHSGNEHNEACDKLAKTARESKGQRDKEET